MSDLLTPESSAPLPSPPSCPSYPLTGQLLFVILSLQCSCHSALHCLVGFVLVSLFLDESCHLSLIMVRRRLLSASSSSCHHRARVAEVKLGRLLDYKHQQAEERKYSLASDLSLCLSLSLSLSLCLSLSLSGLYMVLARMQLSSNARHSYSLVRTHWTIL
jgi:hypothetical protein